MNINMSLVNLINLIFISWGIGICMLCRLYVTTASHMDKVIRKYFQIFFTLVLIYITNHLIRQLLDGGHGIYIRFALIAVTFMEIVAAGFMSNMISVLVVFVSDANVNKKKTVIFLHALLGIHVLLMIINLFTGFICYFDSNNFYQRGSLYILSNICPIIMLVIDMVMLLRFGKDIDRRLKSAFWFYLIAPLVAIIIQIPLYGLQLIIFASIIAAVYMFIVVIKIHNERYEKQKEDNSRIETELALATKIQADMLPSLFPAFPEREEFSLYATMTPAKEVGGDFYDFFLVDNDHLGLVVADVSGKGVPAAMFMMFTKNIIAHNVMLGKSPAVALADANAAICLNNNEGMFLTVWLGVLEISTGRLVYADAGHEKLAYYKDGYWRLMDKKYSGIALGMFDNEMIENLPEKRHIVNQEIYLKPGDAIFQYTDGVTEANNSKDELFGEIRLLEACADSPDADPNVLIPHIREEINNFVKEAPQFDDLTMLGVCYKGSSK